MFQLLFLNNNVIVFQGYFINDIINGYGKNFLDNKLIYEGNFKDGFKIWFNQTVVGFQKGAINMVAVGLAIATAGVIVGAVGSTGLSTNLIVVIESVAKDNVIILILLTIVLCLLLGMYQKQQCLHHLHQQEQKQILQKYQM